MRNPEIADSGFLFVDGVEDIEDVDGVLDTDTTGDVVGADGVVLDSDLPDEMIGVEVIGGEGDLDGLKTQSKETMTTMCKVRARQEMWL